MAGAAAALAGVLLLGARRVNTQYLKSAITGSNMPRIRYVRFGLVGSGFNGSQLMVSDFENTQHDQVKSSLTPAAAAAGAIRSATDM